MAIHDFTKSFTERVNGLIERVADMANSVADVGKSVVGEAAFTQIADMFGLGGNSNSSAITFDAAHHEVAAAPPPPPQVDMSTILKPHEAHNFAQHIGEVVEANMANLMELPTPQVMNLRAGKGRGEGASFAV